MAEECAAPPKEVNPGVVFRLPCGYESEPQQKDVFLKALNKDGPRDMLEALPPNDEQNNQYIVKCEDMNKYCPVKRTGLEKSLEYIKAHFGPDAPTMSEEALKKFDQEFLKVEPITLSEIIEAANYLHCEQLLDFMALAIADLIRGLTPEEIREMFEIKNDFEEEEQKIVDEEIKWALDELSMLRSKAVIVP